MMNYDKKKLTDITVLLLRIAVGFVFIQTGGVKLFGWFGGIPPQGGSAPISSQAGIGGMLEFFGGILIMFGLYTRLIGFILSGEMAVAYWQFHAHVNPWPVKNQGQTAILCCFICLFLAAYGAGRFSLDNYFAEKPVNNKPKTKK